MVALEYRGPAPVSNADLVTESYVQGLTASNLTDAAVTALLSAGLSPYVLRSYVDTQDALNATTAYINTGDATRLHLSQKGAVNGIADLDASGKVNIARVNAASTQRFPSPFYSPSAYHGSTVSATTTEVQIYTLIVTDPGYSYKVLITGTIDAFTTVDGVFPVVRVRAGSTTGPIWAAGAGTAETYHGGIVTAYLSAGTFVYSVPPWADTVDAIALGGGGAGGAGGNLFAVVNGPAGAAGGWNYTTLTRGSTLPGGTTQLTATVAAASGGGGNFSSVSGVGVTTLVAGGGPAAVGGLFQPVGAAAGSITFDGNTFFGGGAQPVLGGAGNPPGGGGAGGAYGAITPNPGGPGANGAVWLVAMPPNNVPSGPVSIIPTALNAQSPLSGDTTLYVMLARAGSSGTVSASTVNPKLYVTPIPA